ncbi:MAG: AAA family ATPase [Acidobacteriia bacterium]|nr:AAA family ATPase [Terriglobia bacterium]
MATLTQARCSFLPPVPQNFADLGVPESLVLDLMLRRMVIEGFSSMTGLSRSIRVSLPIVDLVFKHMRSQQLVEIKGMSGNDYQFVLSAAGKQLAGERFQVSQYAGACPVSLNEYHAATKAQSARISVDRRMLRQAFSDLVVSDKMLDQMGPAIISQTSIFVYGPTGNGKTSLAERMLRVYQDAVMIPYAVEVDNQIISVFDPVVHHPVDHDDADVDPRWILCKRPCILVGGELIPSMLELRLDESSGIYAAPLQMKANNGILLIDDFGRQLMSPRDLLNRWIVPLDRRVDYLTLRYGIKFQIPFELMVVFSTNLEPSDLADEAFLRRIHNKIYVEAVDGAAFDQIFARVVQARNIQSEADSAEYLRKLCLREGRTELRACYPSDICNILLAIGRYEGRPPQMTKPELERAAALYFARS